MISGSNAKRGQDSSDGLRGAFDVWYGDRGGDSGGLKPVYMEAVQALL